MIDIATIEAHMRDANPIRHLDEVDPDELSFAVAVAHTRRASVMQAPTQHPTPTTPLTPPPQRRKAWAAVAAAFVLALAAIGAAALVMRGGDGEVADTPPVPTTLVEPDVATTGAGEEPTASALLDGSNTYDAEEFYGAWHQVGVDEPWVDSILDIEAMSDGGFVVVTVEPYPSNVVWSPDGVEWFNADPQQLLPPLAWSDSRHRSNAIPLYNVLDVGPVPITLGRPPGEPGLIAVSEALVALVDPDSTAVYFGDPVTGDWTSVDLDTSGLADHVEPAFVAARGDLLLVAGWVEVTDPPTDPDSAEPIPTVSLVGWIVDTEQGTAAQTPMPAVTARFGHGEAPELAWFDGRWLLLVGEPHARGNNNYSLWTAPDAASWNELALPSELEYLSLTVGTRGVTIGPRGGDYIWHSADLADWKQTFANTPETHNITRPAYSDALGYVVLQSRIQDPDFGDVLNRVVMSVDGVDWHEVGPARPDQARYAAASGDRLLVYDVSKEEWSREDGRPWFSIATEAAKHRLWLWSMD